MSCQSIYHEGLTCTEYRKGKEEVDQETLDWIKKHTKPCPKCGTKIEKNNGCNHMICTKPGCGVHFCWLCLHSADSTNKIHQHLNREHGGLFTMDQIIY